MKSGLPGQECKMPGEELPLQKLPTRNITQVLVVRATLRHLWLYILFNFHTSTNFIQCHFPMGLL